ncbi:hypothetical protein E4631_23055 [Hymenobacter sp. UV11]|uniref:DDE-type integrase/transposase/recombinase n=1 Tax=Hymenobacter sp. UV11 TaxID=1849735 RepID=UPI00105E8FB8|nr:hypothetical protein A8B98_18220 [Hymenobacter sp. UV11]TFZ63371.1 hypothetical protein E4631_23055 [Hymenobacter sp. UV11]
MGDITYLALVTGQGAYLACWGDAVERRVVGWHVSESLHTDLMLTAFKRAVAVCQPPPGLLVHADRGSHYSSAAFTQLLDRTRAIASLSRPGQRQRPGQEWLENAQNRAAAPLSLLCRPGSSPLRTDRIPGPLV